MSSAPTAEVPKSFAQVPAVAAQNAEPARDAHENAFYPVVDSMGGIRYLKSDHARRY